MLDMDIYPAYSELSGYSGYVLGIIYAGDSICQF